MLEVGVVPWSAYGEENSLEFKENLIGLRYIERT